MDKKFVLTHFLKGKIAKKHLVKISPCFNLLSDRVYRKILKTKLYNPFLGFLFGIIPFVILPGLSLDRIYRGDFFSGIIKIGLWLFIIVLSAFQYNIVIMYYTLGDYLFIILVFWCIFDLFDTRSIIFSKNYKTILQIICKGGK
ncbi:hypothetical protein OQH60_04790 [Campylobacter sp. MIT 21-1685]|uniref:hypothetical protein n=1 Tax=unclassified Campylobacter TaxID=2593542 RepID=UPI00224B449E|nr:MULTISPECIES: hypothetical protein [unclassified Campylobacter]MCX2683181.1 hypothetical protein [Campylobacter sp. MIT 21-1684]MCX2751499.1 hypothetical protein [Campylobacter sp. MIT 21-1682]MCX2807662.1 hypothetical protein [Campylobacter sp. MIT 21-1685]